MLTGQQLAVIAPLLLALLAAPAAVFAGLLRPRSAAPTGAFCAALAFLATLLGHLFWGGGVVDVA